MIVKDSHSTPYSGKFKTQKLVETVSTYNLIYLL